jgi:class 3 adenylate cyclase
VAGAERLDQLIAKAQDVSPVTGFLEGEQDVAVAYARQVAQGLVRLRSRSSGRADPSLSGRPDTASGEALSWAAPTEAGQTEGPKRRLAALIFADFAGFSRLPDTDLPAYWDVLMPALSQALARHSRSVLLQQTWGDALYLVLDGARPAAMAALDILRTLSRVRSELSGGLSSIMLRLSIHYAPVFIGWDPIGLTPLYYGSHVSLAARIEPVTPPGTIYVSEALAAQLALEGTTGLELTYAGEVELAKHYGRARAFHLRETCESAVGSRGRAGVTAAQNPGDTVIGGTGSLLLTHDQREWVRAVLMQRILPELHQRLGSVRMRFCSGLAPGADITFIEAARDWATLGGVPHHIQSVLPVPVEALLADWNERASQAGIADVEQETRANWSRMKAVLAESASVISLLPADADFVELAIRSFRQRQYRALGAHLLAHSDVLVAIYNRQVAGGPGGTAEVVSWWRDPRKVPVSQGAPIVRPGLRLLAVLDPVNREVTVEACAASGRYP